MMFVPATLVLAVPILGGVAFGLSQGVHERALEDISHQFAPSAARAFEYGNRYFNSETSGSYDVNRAEYFFTKASELDSNYPYVFHELARISFLRGDFRKALGQINLQIEKHGDSAPKSFYVRGLIEGFMGQYGESAGDYEIYLQSNPTNWAALNDYAWVLLKGGRYHDALRASEKGLVFHPDNPWLLNSKAVALYEIGDLDAATEAAHEAALAAITLSEKDWLRAYPGNDPLIATEGLTALRDAILNNIHTISFAQTQSR